MKLTRAIFSDLPHWEKDDHALSFKALKHSCASYKLRVEEDKVKQVDPKRLKMCKALLAKDLHTNEQARAFFEEHFDVVKVVLPTSDSLLTGYFEPVLKGSRTKSKTYHVPVYRRPEDLVSKIDDVKRAAFNNTLSAGREVKGKLVPYATRQQIEQGALKGRGLELLYLADPVDTFFMHVQGSAKIQLDTGETIRIGFDGKNGHPYSSIGLHMKKAYGRQPGDLSMAKIKSWLNADKKRGAKVMWHNKSFIFFRELDADLGRDGPIGAEGVSLSAGRSLAVDGAYHQLGLPIYVVSPNIDHYGGDGFYRLMIAQDVGSAIRGQVRGDIYWGSGDEAGKIAGSTKQEGEFYLLLPK